MNRLRWRQIVIAVVLLFAVALLAESVVTLRSSEGETAQAAEAATLAEPNGSAPSANAEPGQSGFAREPRPQATPFDAKDPFYPADMPLPDSGGGSVPDEGGGSPDSGGGSVPDGGGSIPDSGGGSVPDGGGSTPVPKATNTPAPTPVPKGNSSATPIPGKGNEGDSGSGASSGGDTNADTLRLRSLNLNSEVIVLDVNADSYDLAIGDGAEGHWFVAIYDDFCVGILSGNIENELCVGEYIEATP